MITRIRTPGDLKLKMRYEIGPTLGSGQFGTVYKCIDVDTGRLMALKKLTRPSKKSQEDWREELYYILKREVETLSDISHPHIVDYITAQSWEGQPGQDVEIFMGLKEGTLESLVDNHGSLSSSTAESIFSQMLQTLDFLACLRIVHRDVKPENILYKTHPNNQYQFQFDDFSLCNRIVDAVTLAGSYLYMAPEIFHNGSQTSKVNVWSLFVTILWSLNAGGFRQKTNCFRSIEDIRATIVSIASNLDSLSKLKQMAAVDPNDRPSAAQLLVKFYKGVGLSTPPSQIPDFPESPTCAVPTARNARTVRPTSRTTEAHPRGLQRDGNVFAAALQCRIENARDPFSGGIVAQQTPHRLLRPRPTKG